MHLEMEVIGGVLLKVYIWLSFSFDNRISLSNWQFIKKKTKVFFFLNFWVFISLEKFLWIQIRNFFIKNNKVVILYLRGRKKRWGRQIFVLHLISKSKLVQARSAIGISPVTKCPVNGNCSFFSFSIFIIINIISIIKI